MWRPEGDVEMEDVESLGLFGAPQPPPPRAAPKPNSAAPFPLRNTKMKVVSDGQICRILPVSCDDADDDDDDFHIGGIRNNNNKHNSASSAAPATWGDAIEVPDITA